MAVIVPPSSAAIEHPESYRWHQTYKIPWHDLVAIDYVLGAVPRMYTENVTDLTATDGHVSFFGEAYLEPEIQPALKTSNATFYVVSSSASDTGIARCWMVDEDGVEHIKSITLTGTTPSIIGSYIHCNMVMYLGGTAQNVGNITVSTKSIAGVPLIITDFVQAHIGVTRGHGNNPRQLCPNDQVYVFSAMDVSSDKADGIDVHINLGRIIMDTGPHSMRTKQWLVYQSVMNETFDIPLAISPGEYLDTHIERSAAGTGAVNAALNIDMYILTQESEATAGISRLFRP